MDLLKFRSAIPRPFRGWQAGALASCLALVLLLGVTPPAHAGQPFIWDDDSDGLDDRMEQVQILGFRYAFTGADSVLGQQRFEVVRVSGNLVYGVYVVFKQQPDSADLAALTALGMPVLHRYESVPAVRTTATFAQANAAKALPTVERVEVVPLLYPETREDAASIGVTDPTSQVFPNWTGVGGGDGSGVVVAILDTGVNDAADGAYPGHESLIGRCVGGGSFANGDSTLDTPPGGSENPGDHGHVATHDHGTHIAGIVCGSGGPSGYAAGIAPGARFVDVKVLDDAGVGTGIAEALDWCIHNRTRDWGGGAHGIQVINMSLSSPDESDGNDVPAQLAARAAQLGIVVVASMGNDGADHHVPSPAAGDGVLAVGAYDAQRTPAADDDVFASFSNRGPRASDGDADAADEQKPDLVAPGMAVLSADGDVSSDGTKYKRMSGTSMSAAVVSGAVAALRSEFPSLTPAQIADVLRATARRSLNGVPSGPAGDDPRWSAAIGWGALDLYAARLELLQPTRSQIRRLALTTTADQIAVTLWTQRELGATHFVLERAADAGGAPGEFAPVDSVAAAGSGSLALGDLTSYALVLPVPAEEHGVPFWYRVSYTEGGQRWNTPSRALASPVGPSAATIHVRIVHDAYDHDVDGVVKVGGTTGLLRSGPSAPDVTSPTFPLPGSSAAVSSDYVSGTSATGTIAWDFTLEVPAGAADEFLPPSTNMPWRLEVTEGGYVNRSGRVDAFSIVWHGPQGDQTYVGQPTPLLTLEGQTATVLAPHGTNGVDGRPGSVAFRAAPSPVRAGGNVTFVATGANPGVARIYDLAGRLSATAAFIGAGDHWIAHWNTGDAGSAIRAGIYFARAGRAQSRIVVLER